jgi:glyoxylase-like metal-dependent hydrolase (beta-lactamase superfamily II)
MFRGLGEQIAHELQGVELATPDVVYDQEHDLDLGGRVVTLRATGRAHSRGDQVIRVEDILFTGDLVETGQFAIFPWFPPHDADVSGLRWIEVMRRLAESNPRVVIPGHGDSGGAQLLTDVQEYLELLRDETWRRRDSAMDEQTIVAEVTDVLTKLHPDWAGREWIEKGVGCLCAERT